MICRHIPTHGWVCGWLGGSVDQWVSSGQMTNNLINLDLINIIQFCLYKARHAHKRLYTVLPKYSKIQVLPGITSCRLVKDNKQAIELNSLLINNMPEGGYEWN